MSGGINVKKIVRDYLIANNYDGLVDSDGGCGCWLDDLFPCDLPCQTCRPGYKGPDPEHEAPWLIYPTREAAQQAEAVE